MKHLGVFINNRSKKSDFIQSLLKNRPPAGLEEFRGKKGVLFSKLALLRFIDEEDRHGIQILNKETTQTLKSMSSGEQKKALLRHLFNGNPDYIILDNPFDNLDTDSQKSLRETLSKRSEQTVFIQIISRKTDILSFIYHYSFLNKDSLEHHKSIASVSSSMDTEKVFSGTIPPSPEPSTYLQELLIALKNVTVSFGEKMVLQSINWEIKRKEFWQLKGKNGSGKTTLLSMITGENPKGYGQDLFLFGFKKGSGESIWDIKKHIGYFTPSMTDKFKGRHTIENMLISGLTDSIGLYVRPTESQQQLAKKWLELIHMWHMKDQQFCSLSMGEQRLIMTVRAMLKHPLLLILDEPTEGLDDASAALLVSLVNKISRESETTTIFVSHRDEPNLQPDFIYELKMTENGSVGEEKSSESILK